MFTSVVHRLGEHGVVAHGGFAREVSVWAAFFREVVVVSPQANGSAEADAVPYSAPNVRFLSLGRPVSTAGLGGKIRLLAHAARWMRRCRLVIREDDVLMARGPDSVGFLGYVLSRGRQMPRFAKYADEWRPFAGEPLGYRAQKWLYGRPGFGGPVLIYGEPDPQRPHLVPFLPSSVTQEEWNDAGERIGGRFFGPPFRLLFVGRLVPAKGADVLLRALARLTAGGTPATVDLVGDGPERQRLVHLANELGVAHQVQFRGWLGGDQLAGSYAAAHCFVHCSRKEGFGKVLLEAMTHALPVVATDVGVSKALVRPPHAGWIIPPGRPDLLAKTLKSALDDLQDLNTKGRHAREIVVPFILERQTGRYRTFLEQELGLSCE